MRLSAPAVYCNGLTKMVLKPDAWKLFRHTPSDYTRTVAASITVLKANSMKVATEISTFLG